MKLTKGNTVAVFIDFQEKLMPAMNGREELEKRTSQLARGLNAMEVPCIVTQQYTKGIGETVPVIAEAIGQFVPIDKTTFSCMGNEDFVSQLEMISRPNVIVCGIEAHICVQQTVLQLLNEGYRVYVAADCISSRNQNDMMWAAERMEKAGAVITTYEAILYEILGDSKDVNFKEISAIVK